MMSNERLSDQERTRQVAQNAVDAAGHTASRFASDADLELYFDITNGERDVGFIAKGWSDPGFRIGHIVALPQGSLAISEPPAYLREFCATNGITLLISPEGEAAGWLLEYVIYSSGFNAETLRESIGALIECTERVELDLRGRCVEALFRNLAASSSVPAT